MRKMDKQKIPKKGGFPETVCSAYRDGSVIRPADVQHMYETCHEGMDTKGYGTGSWKSLHTMCSRYGYLHRIAPSDELDCAIRRYPVYQVVRPLRAYYQKHGEPIDQRCNLFIKDVNKICRQWIQNINQKGIDFEKIRGIIKDLTGMDSNLDFDFERERRAESADEIRKINDIFQFIDLNPSFEGDLLNAFNATELEYLVSRINPMVRNIAKRYCERYQVDNKEFIHFKELKRRILITLMRHSVGILDCKEEKFFQIARDGILPCSTSNGTISFMDKIAKRKYSTIEATRQLHNEKAPSLYYDTIEPQYYLRNVHVSKEFHKQLMDKTYDVRQIFTLTNMEERSLVLYYMGAERILYDCNAKLIDKSLRGNELYSIPKLIVNQWNNLPAEPIDIKILKYSCPSTNRTYFKFVPFNMMDADEAQAWSFSLSKEQYDRLVIES